MSSPRPPPGAPPGARKPRVAPPSGPPPSSARSRQPPSGRNRPQPPSGRRPPPTRKKNTVAPPKGAPPSDRSRPKGKLSRRRQDSSSSSSSSDSDDSGWVKKNPNGNVYSENKKRIHLKKKNKYDEDDPPMKSNDYHGMRMSAVLRGEREGLPQPGELLYEEDFEDYEPDGMIDYIKHAFFKKSKERKFGPRFALCIFAVALLWLSSAAACRAVVTLFIPTPSYNEIETRIVQLQDTTTEQQTAYEDCVVVAFNDCEATFDNQMTTEGLRLQAVQQANIATIESEDAIRSVCRAEYEKALEELENVNFLLFEVGNAPAECDNLNQLVGSQLNSLESVNTAQSTADGSNAAVDDFEQQLAEREAYDREYQQNFTSKFGAAAGALRENLYNSTNFRDDLRRQQNELRACMSENGVIVVDGETFECQGQAIVDEARQVINSYQQEYDAMNQTVQDYINEVQGYVDDVERIQQIASTLSFDFANMPLPSLGQLEGAMRLGLNGLGISNEEIDEFIEAREQELEQAIADAEAEVEALEAEIAAKQQEFIDNATREFEEQFPGISPETQQSAEDSRQAANALSGQVAEDLDSVNDEAGEVQEPTGFDIILNGTNVDFLQGIEDRAIDFFAYDQNIFFELEGKLNNIINAVLIFDTVWRVLQSILLFKKYWNISAVATPPADVRSDKGMLFKEKKGPFQAIAGILTNPIVQVLYNLLVIFAISVLFYLAYNPLFGEFVDGCINNDFRDIVNGSADGTMIFRNLNTMTGQKAASDGDQKITELIDGINLERQLACSDLLQDSVAVRQDHITTHSDLARNFNALSEKYNLFDQCIDWVAFDNSAVSAGIAFDMDPLFSRAECNRVILDIDVSDNVLHNCDNVEPCTHACGPNFVEMARVNHNAACTTEYALHSYFLVGLFATTMFICLNLSRFYLLNGIIEVGWPTLCLDVFSYLVSCTERGTIIPPPEVEDGEPFSDVIERALDKALRKYTVKGYLDLFFALAINLPWVVFMIVFSQDISYRAQ